MLRRGLSVETSQAPSCYSSPACRHLRSRVPGDAGRSGVLPPSRRGDETNGPTGVPRFTRRSLSILRVPSLQAALGTMYPWRGLSPRRRSRRKPAFPWIGSRGSCPSASSNPASRVRSVSVMSSEPKLVTACSTLASPRRSWSRLPPSDGSTSTTSTPICPANQRHAPIGRFADFVASAGSRASPLPAVYEVLGGCPSPIHRRRYLDEEAMFERLLEGLAQPVERRGRPPPRRDY